MAKPINRKKTCSTKCSKKLKNEYQKLYHQSEKGKEIQKRYRSSKKGKENSKKHQKLTKEKIPFQSFDHDKISFGGPIQDTKKINAFDDDLEFDSETLENHIPSMELRPLDPKNYSVLTASDQKKLKIAPNTYANPMQILDYKIYETLLKHTFVGALADSFLRYLVGAGFKPELELINPDEDEKINSKLINAHQDIITNLIKIDNHVDYDPEGTIDATFKEKIISAMASALFYNRGALIFNYGSKPPLVLDGTSYDVPDLIFAHAQELGIIELDEKTRRLSKVQWRHQYGELVNVQNMIYIWNPITSSKVYNSWFYGISILSPLISASKLLRQILSEDLPAMAKTTWAGLYLFAIKNEGNTKESKIEEYESVVKTLKPGRPAILIKDPEDIAHFDINFNPKIDEFRILFESMVKLCISVTGLPQVGFYDEASPTKSTMLAKIELTDKTVMGPIRDVLGNQVTNQWYNPWFKRICKDKPELLEIFKIKLVWSNIQVGEWYDTVQAALDLDGRLQLKNREFGKLIHKSNYETMVDPDKKVVPGGIRNSKGGNGDGTDSGEGGSEDSVPGKGSMSKRKRTKSPKENKPN